MKHSKRITLRLLTVLALALVAARVFAAAQPQHRFDPLGLMSNSRQETRAETVKGANAT